MIAWLTEEICHVGLKAYTKTRANNVIITPLIMTESQKKSHVVFNIFYNNLKIQPNNVRVRFFSRHSFSFPCFVYVLFSRWGFFSHRWYMCYFLDGIRSDTVGICVIFSTGFVLTPLVYVLFSRRDSFWRR
jgi:TRAP-type mannitol/chloroaromatic compound transport system permease small subunit